MNNINKLLTEHFPPEMERILNKGGASLIYIPVSEVVTRLNKVIGTENWSFEVISHYRDSIDTDFIVAHVRITWFKEDGSSITKDGIGGQKIKRTKQGTIVDLGDEFKGAVSDALKKAAQMLGIGLYLARSDDAMDVEDAIDSTQPVSPSDPEIDAKWDNFVSVLKTLGDDKKSLLNDFWTKKANGKPKPTKSTATHEALDLLLEEMVRLSFDGQSVSLD